VVESDGDDDQWWQTLAERLGHAGILVTTVTRAGAADFDVAADVVVVNLDGSDAPAMCSALREAGHRFVMAASSNPSSADCIRALDAGADSYVSDRHALDEIVTRVRKLVQLSGQTLTQSPVEHTTPVQHG